MVKNSSNVVKKKLREELSEVTEGVLENVVDFSLFLTLWGIDIFWGTSPAAKGNLAPGDMGWMEDALELMNYQAIKRAINNARKKGWIEPAGRGKRVDPKITEAGKKRLNAKLPFYDKERCWDEVLHLVTYDVPEERRKDREMLRDHLQRVGCGMLQKSVWITPYNPRNTLQEFIQARRLKGAIIISSLGKDGSIGDDSVEDLVYKVYQLDGLNERYRKFLDRYGNRDKQVLSVIFSYLSILQDDPQLPFKLLPDDWLGDRAYKVYRYYLKQSRKE